MTEEFIELLEALIVSYIADEGEKLQEVYKAIAYSLGKIETLAKQKDVDIEILERIFKAHYQIGKDDALDYVNKDENIKIKDEKIKDPNKLMN